MRMVSPVQVMNDQNVDPGYSQTLHAVLVRAHYPVVGVVEADLEVERLAPGPPVLSRPLRVGPRAQEPANFGRKDVVGARLGPQKSARAVLAETKAVPGGGVEVAYAGLPGGVERPHGIVLRKRGHGIAERRRTKAEVGHVAKTADLSRVPKLHFHVLSCPKVATTAGDRRRLPTHDHDYR